MVLGGVLGIGTDMMRFIQRFLDGLRFTNLIPPEGTFPAERFAMSAVLTVSILLLLLLFLLILLSRAPLLVKLLLPRMSLTISL